MACPGQEQEGHRQAARPRTAKRGRAERKEVAVSVIPAAIAQGTPGARLRLLGGLWRLLAGQLDDPRPIDRADREGHAEIDHRRRAHEHE